MSPLPNIIEPPITPIPPTSVPFLRTLTTVPSLPVLLNKAGVLLYLAELIIPSDVATTPLSLAFAAEFPHGDGSVVPTKRLPPDKRISSEPSEPNQR